MHKVALNSNAESARQQSGTAAGAPEAPAASEAREHLLRNLDSIGRDMAAMPRFAARPASRVPSYDVTRQATCSQSDSGYRLSAPAHDVFVHATRQGREAVAGAAGGDEIRFSIDPTEMPEAFAAVAPFLFSEDNPIEAWSFADVERCPPDSPEYAGAQLRLRIGAKDYSAEQLRRIVDFVRQLDNALFEAGVFPGDWPATDPAVPGCRYANYHNEARIDPDDCEFEQKKALRKEPLFQLISEQAAATNEAAGKSRSRHPSANSVSSEASSSEAGPSAVPASDIKNYAEFVNHHLEHHEQMPGSGAAEWDRYLMEDLVSMANRKQPALNLHFANSAKEFVAVLKGMRDRDEQSIRVVANLGTDGLHMVAFDVSMSDQQHSIIGIESATLDSTGPALLAIRYESAVSSQFPGTAFRIISSDLQRSRGECGMFSLALAKKMLQEQAAFLKLHEQNARGEAIQPDQLPPSLMKHAQSERRLRAYLSKNPGAENVIVNKRGETLLARQARHIVNAADSKTGRKITYSNSIEVKRSIELQALWAHRVDEEQELDRAALAAEPNASALDTASPRSCGDEENAIRQFNIDEAGHIVQAARKTGAEETTGPAPVP